MFPMMRGVTVLNTPVSQLSEFQSSPAATPLTGSTGRATPVTRAASVWTGTDTPTTGRDTPARRKMLYGHS